MSTINRDNLPSGEESIGPYRFHPRGQLSWWYRCFCPDCWWHHGGL